MTLVLTDTQKCALRIQPVDAKGYDVPVDGVPAWSTSDDTVAAIAPSTDGLAATVIAGAPGTAQISVSADADLGAGVVTITGTLDVQVIAGQAVTLTIATGTPEEAI